MFCNIMSRHVISRYGTLCRVSSSVIPGNVDSLNRMQEVEKDHPVLKLLAPHDTFQESKVPVHNRMKMNK